MACIQGFMIKHNMPMVQIGFGRASLAHKLMALLHAFHLVSIRGKWLLQLVKSLVAAISDYGTERGAARVRPVPWKQMFLWFPPPSEQFENRYQADEVEFAPQSDDIDLSGMVDVAGLLHVIHNCGRGLESALMCFEEGSHRLEKLSNLLRKPESKERLQQTCFNDPVSAVLFAKGLKHFNSRCYVDRWGTVADSIFKMNTDTFTALNNGWNLRKYTSSDEAQEDNADDETPLSLIDESIRDKFWQSYWLMLRRIAKIILRCLAWAEGCCCHDGILRGMSGDDSDEEDDGDEPLPSHLVQEAKKCPLRGRRCAELAAGDFDRHYQRLFSVQLAKVNMELHHTLNPLQRFKIIADFDRARCHIASIFVLKLAHWREAPYQLFGIAHFEPDRALRSFNRAMTMNSGHELEVKLKSAEMQADRDLFVAGGGRLPDAEGKKMRELMTELRLTPSAERTAEGVHSNVHRECKRCPNHSHALMSLSFRAKEFATHISKSQINTRIFAHILHRIPNGRAACENLGLDKHPMSAMKAQGGASRRDPMHFAVMYRADAFTKYTYPPPALSLASSSTRPAPGLFCVQCRHM